MNRLASYPNFFNATQCILISGKGYPDCAARLLLARIQLAYPNIPICMLADADPHGLHIALVYLAALPEHTTFKYIGIRPSDRDGVLDGLGDDVLLPLEQREITLANALIQILVTRHGSGKTAIYHDIATELQFILRTGQKFEVEALAALDDDHCTLIEYIKSKLGGIIDHQALTAPENSESNPR